MDSYREHFEVIALVLITILYPFHWRSEALWSMNLSLADPIVGITLVLFLAGFLYIREFHMSIFLALGFVAIVAIGALVHTYTDPEYFSVLTSYVGLIKLLATISWMIAIYVLVSPDPERRIWIIALLTAVLAGSFAGWSFISDVVFDVRRPSGPFGNPNLFADYLLLSIFLCVTWLDRLLRSENSRPVVTVLFAISIACSFLGILSTASRSALVALLVGLVVALNFRRLTIAIVQDPKKIALSLLGGGGLVVFLATAELTIIRRFSRVLEGEQLGPRPEVWKHSFGAFTNHPIFGVGIGQHSNYIDAAGILPNPHNTIVLVSAETGLIGLLFFVAFVAVLLRESAALRFSQASSPLRLFVGFFVASSINGLFHDAVNFRSFWIAAGLFAAAMVTHAKTGTEDQTRWSESTASQYHDSER